MRAVLVAIQAGTFGALGLLLLTDGNWRLGAAQLFLAAVTGLVYI